VLRERLVADLRRLGATGYTISEVHGHGSKGVSEQFWANAQLRLETLASAAVAEAILRHLQDAYFSSFSVIAYAMDVDVLRPEKFV
jgi:nitrogen regulatory protein P-II 2